MSRNEPHGGTYDEELLSECEEMLFRLALLEVEQNRADALAKQLEHAAPYAIKCPCGTESTLPAGLERKLWQYGVRRRMRISKAARIAACALIICALGLGTAFAALPSLRLYFSNIVSDARSVRVETGSEYIDIPAFWQGRYYPARIPDGYAPAPTSASGGEVTPGNTAALRFENADGNYFTFEEHSSSDFGEMDISSASVRYDKVNGAPALIIARKDSVAVVWADFETTFMLETNLDLKFALRLARGVKRIPN